MRTIITHINNDHPAVAYFRENTAGTKAVRNTANFLIRNTYTGLRKSPEERTLLETEALHLVFTGIHMQHEAAHRRQEKIAAKLNRLAHSGNYGMRLYRMVLQIRDMEFLSYPTREKWMLSYKHLDAIMKYHNLPCYRRCVSHVAQQAIKKTESSWKSYFKALRSWKMNPSKFKSRPGLPGYLRFAEATAHFTNQAAKPFQDGKNFALELANFGTVTLCPYELVRGKFIKLEVQPVFDGYRLLITYQERFPKPVLPENPKRIAGMDPGMTNFVSVATNTGMTPFIIDGSWIKALNQWFNKERARLISALTSGADSQHSRKTSKRLRSLSADRTNQIRDFFYKCGHTIFRKLQADRIEVLVIGHNKDQKQGINIGHENNQAFVSIPFLKFIQVMQTLSAEYGIPVVVREESYTSRASCLDLDDIPTYHPGSTERYVFSGRRIKRGLYRAKDGRLLNADINAAANILRKEYPEAFHDVDMTCLCTTTQKISAYEILRIKKVPNHASQNKRQNRKSDCAMVNHRMREKRQYELDTAFQAKHRTPWVPPKKKDQAKTA